MLPTRRLPHVGALAIFLLLPAQLPAALGVEKVQLVTGVPFPVGGVTLERGSLLPKPVFSDDGRYVVFDAWTGAITTGTTDANGRRDVFLADLQTGERTLLSHAAGKPGIAAKDDSYDPLISGDGRFVAFTSLATDLVAGGAGGSHVYLLDRQTGSVVQVTQAAGNDSGAHVLTFSNDGRYLAIQIWDVAALVPGVTDANGAYDVVLWDRVAGSFQLVTRRAVDPLTTSAIPPVSQVAKATLSTDGRYLVYTSAATELHAGDTTADNDVYLFDRTTGGNTLVSSGGSTAPSLDLSASPDGRFVLFHSTGDAGTFVAGVTDANGGDDLFLYDRVAGSAELVSRSATSATQTANGTSDAGVVSPDGRRVYFRSWANDVAPGMVDPFPLTNSDLFLRDRQTNTISLVSTENGDPNDAANREIDAIRGTDAAGTTLFFEAANGLVAGTSFLINGTFVYRYEVGGQVEMLGARPGNPQSYVPGSVLDWSPDLSTVIFQTPDLQDSPIIPDLLGIADPFDRGHLLLYSTADDTFELMNPAVVAGNSSKSPGIFGISAAQISGDGRYVAFSGDASICGKADVDFHRGCLFDRETGSVSSLVHGWDDPDTPVATGGAVPYAISYDGGKILLGLSSPDLPPDDPNGNGCDLVLYDTAERSYELISHAAGAPNTAPNGESCPSESAWTASVITDDLQQVIFGSSGTNLVAGVTNAAPENVFVKHRGTGVVRLLSSAAGNPARTANRKSTEPQIAKNGSAAVFLSEATDLVAGFADHNGNGFTGFDLYHVDLATGTVKLVSHAAGSTTDGADDDVSTQLHLSADGRFVAYQSRAANLIVGGVDTNGLRDVFLYDSATGQSTLVSHAAGQPLVAAGFANLAGLSSDGRYVLYNSTASNVLPGVAGGQVYLWDRVDGTTRLVSHLPENTAQGLPMGASAAGMSNDGRRVYLQSSQRALAPGVVESDFDTDVFVWDRDDGTYELITRPFASMDQAAGAALLSIRYFRPFDGDGDNVLFVSNAGNLVLHDSNNLGVDLFVATLSPTLLRDGFETGNTSRWWAAVP